MRLTPKQQRFVEEYLVDLDASAAARRAGYSVRTAGQVGYQLLQKTSIAESISAAQLARSQRTQVTADRVVRELARIAFADVRALFQWGPDGVKLLKSADLTDDQAAAVESVAESVTQGGGSLKLKTHSKVAALQLLGKHLGMFVDRIEATVGTTLEVIEEVVDASDAPA